MAYPRVLLVAVVLLPGLASALQLDEYIYSLNLKNEGIDSSIPINSMPPIHPKGRLTPLELARQSVGLPNENSKDKTIDVIGVALEVIFNQALKPIYLPYSDNVNEECYTDVRNKNFYDNLKEKKWWALQMFDSWGKLPDGFLFGNLRSTGMYEECLGVVANYSTKIGIIGPTVWRNYKGRYCQVYYDLSPKNESALVREGIPIEDPSSPLPFSYGTCIPSTCTTEDMWMSVNETLNAVGLSISHVECYSEDDPKEDLTPIDNAMLSIIGIFACIIFLATIYDYLTLELKRTHMRKGFWEVLIGFSFINNLKKIFTYKESSEAITCLSGMKVITILWITICLQYEVATDYITNTVDSLRYQDPVIGQVVTNGWLAVDTFLFISGLVITYRLAPYVIPESLRFKPELRYKINQKGGVFLIYVKNFFRRFLRLSPTIFFVSLFSASLLRFFAYGPRADVLKSFTRDRCEPHWWKDPLFINNYIMGDNEGYDVNDCLDHCWYTAVDMQLLLILPALLLPFLKHHNGGLIWLGIITLGTILTPMSIIIAYNLPPIPLHYMSEAVKFEYMWRVFMTPWCRAGPWVIGVWTALALPKEGQRKIPRIAVIIGYLAAISLGLGLVLGLYPYNHVFPDKDYTENMAMSAAYGALARPAWGLCLAWVVYTCHTGHAGAVNKILSYPGWRPLARITFSMYLVIPLVQLWWSSVQFQPVYYNYLEKLFQSAGVAFISGVVAILISCLVELPICNLVDALMPSPARTQERLQPAEREPEKRKTMSISRI